MTRLLCPLLSLAALLSAAAHAQAFPRSSAPLRPLTGLSPVAFTAPANFPWRADDEGHARLQLGFAFPFGGATFSEVGVSPNGLLVFGAGVTACDNPVSRLYCPLTDDVPIARAGLKPARFIAPWWTDLIPAATGAIRAGTVGPGEWAIEFRDVTWFGGGDFANTSRFNFRVHLFASGLALVHYGQQRGSYVPQNVSGPATTAPLALAGMSDGAAAPTSWLSCAAAGARCSVADLPNDTVVALGQPSGAELMVGTAALTAPSPGSVELAAALRNLGQAGASTPWRAVISADLLPDATDVVLLPAGAAVSVPAGQSAAVSGTASVAGVAPQHSYLLVEVDPQGTVAQSSRLDDVLALGPFAFNAVDLEPTALTPPKRLSSETDTPIPFTVRNHGTQSATFAWSLLLQLPFSATFVTIASGTATAGPLQTVALTAAARAPVPANPATGTLRLEVDPAGALPETVESNNTLQSTVRVPYGRPNLNLRALDVRTPAGGSARVASAQSALVLFAEVANNGVGDAPASAVTWLLSDDTTPSLLSDTVLGTSVVPPVPFEDSRFSTLAFQLPATDRAGQSLTGRRFNVLAVVDAASLVGEGNEADNTLGVLGQLAVGTVAPDFVALDVEGPALLAGGEPAVLRCRGRNDGQAFGTGVSAALYLSPNAVLSPADVELPRISAQGQPTGRALLPLTSTLGGGPDSHLVPDWVPAGDYTLGCVLDAEGAVPELDEANNAVLALSRTTVVPPTLAVDSTPLPDAEVGRAYTVRLRARGEGSGGAWSAVDPLPQGLTLDAQGLLTGTPSAPGLSAFTVALTAQGRTARGLLYLRVAGSGAPLLITTERLPPLVDRAGGEYRARLGVSGGLPPLRFGVLSGSLPPGLTLAADGLLSGSPKAAANAGAYDFTAQVTDAAGRGARRRLSLEVVPRGALALTTPALPSGAVGVPYQARLSASPVDGTALAPPVQWTVTGLPEGLTATSEPDGDARLQGASAVEGSFAVEVQASDRLGRAARGTFILPLLARELEVTSEGSSALERGGAVTFKLVPAAAARFTLSAGELPKGLSLAADGTFSGTVEPTAPLGTYAFAVTAQDEAQRRALLPVALSVSEKKKQGCSSAAGLWPLLAVLVLNLRRRRGRALALAVALAGLPAAAQPAAPPAYQLVGPTPSPYAARTEVAFLETRAFSPVVRLPFSFFAFGVEYQSLVARPGDFRLGNTLDGPTLVPWFPGDWSLGALRVFTLGTAPRRQVLFECADLASIGGAGYDLQVILEEGTNLIRVRYGDKLPVWSGFTRPQWRLGGLSFPLLPCAGSGLGCSTLDYPAGTELLIAPGPDVRATALRSPAALVRGASQTVQVSLENLAAFPAGPTELAIFASADGALDAADPQLGQLQAITVGALQSPSFEVPVRLPASWVGNEVTLFAQFDPARRVPDLDRRNDVARSPALAALAARAELSLTLAAPSVLQASVGGQVTVAATLVNSGSADAPASRVRAFFSSNAVVSATDAQGAALAAPALPVGASTALPLALTVPAGLPEGLYHLGACLDADGAIDEVSEADNCAITAQSVFVSAGALQVLTTALAPAALGSPYRELLRAAGGSSPATFEALELPSGLALGADGTLSGAPLTLGMQAVRVRARAGAQSVIAALSLAVAPQARALSVVGQVLPSAERGTPYRAELTALGGQRPLTWSLAGTLPEGLQLDASGALVGLPTVPGQKDFEVTVTAADGERATGALSLEVVDFGGLRVATARVPSGTLAKAYAAPLVASGGEAPLRYRVASTLLVARDFATAPGQRALGLPQELGLAVAPDASGRWLLQGTPARVGTWLLELEVEDARRITSRAQLLLQVLAEQPLQLRAESLPQGYVGTEYRQALTASGGEAEALRFELPCLPAAGDVGELSCARAGGLPAGLQLSSDGVLSGTPRSATRPVAFFVQVTDTAGRSDLKPYGLEIREASQKPGAGCSTSGGEGLALAAAAWAVSRRRLRGAPLGEPRGATPSACPGGRILGSGAVATDLPSSAVGTDTLQSARGAPTPSRATGTDTRSSALAAPTPSGALGTDTLPSARAAPTPSRATGTDTRSSAVGAGTPSSPRSASAPTSSPQAASWLLLALALVLAGGCRKGPCDTCEGAATCSPDDGVCRCGESVCAPGATCEGAPPVCVASRCAAVTCGGTTRCDPSDGQCKCGGESCGPGFTCDATGARCVALVACSPQTCPAPGSCDATTGACRCGSQACAPGALCRADGASFSCVESPCAQVRCALGTTCDPADGQCRCGAATCAAGERCECAAAADGGCAAGALQCVRADSCADVRCGPGAQCNPQTGLCHCGAPTGPVCASEQTCLLEPARCQGGERCLDADGGARACPGGTACDPEDGQCKCGGPGGQRCGAGQTCVQGPGQFSCRTACTLEQPGCGPGTACFLDLASSPSGAWCAVPTGALGESARCQRPFDCSQADGGAVRTMACIGLSVGNAGVCTSYCVTSLGACPQSPTAQECFSATDTPAGIGLCYPSPD